MADAENPGTSNNADNKQSTENVVSIDKAEYERMKEQTIRVEKWDREAQDAEFDNFEQMIDAADEVLRTQPSQKEEVVTEPAKKPAPVPESQNQVNPELENIKLQVAQTFLNSQFVEFKLSQTELPEDERSTYGKKELMKAVKDNGRLLASLAEDYDGNIFRAASEYLTLKGGKSKARQEGAASEAAKLNAAETAKLTTKGKVGEPTNLTPDEKYQKYVKEQADAIAPDDPPMK